MEIEHTKAILSASRNAILIASALIIYDFLKNMIEVWDKIYYHKKKHHIYYKKTYQLIGVFIIDMIILYSVFYIFGIELY
jgi:hypothetical protein